MLCFRGINMINYINLYIRRRMYVFKIKVNYFLFIEKRKIIGIIIVLFGEFFRLGVNMFICIL